MKKVKEILSDENSFFKKLKEKEPDLYYELFDEIEPALLDGDLLVNCGERYASPLISYHKMDFTVDYVLNRFKDNWRKIRAALTAEYDLLKPYSNVDKTTQETVGTRIDSGTNTQLDGVHGFDSEEAKPASETKGTDDSTQNINQTVTTTYERSGNSGNYTNQNLILNEIELRKQSFIQIVVKDVSNQITLDIY